MKKLLSLFLALVMLLSCFPVTSLADNDPTVLILPVNIETVEEEAFAGDTTIETVVIGKNASVIGAKAFADCTAIKAVSIGSIDVTIAENAFEGCGSDIVFYAHDDSKAKLWALAHGYVFESLDSDTDNTAALRELISISGFDSSNLMSGLSDCLIVRTAPGYNHLPDISAYNPVSIFKSESELYYVQFETVEMAELCAEELFSNDGVLTVEADRVFDTSDIMAEGVTMADNWGSSDVMGFDTYAPFVADNSSGSITIAVIDSGMVTSAWNGKVSASSKSYVDADPFTDSLRHGSKVASIINDCLGTNVTNCTIMPLKVENSNAQFRTIQIIEALKQAISCGADIINMSFGWESYCAEISNQLRIANNMGIIMVGAAGNGTGSVMFPANDANVIAVSALSYSNESGYSVNSRTGKEINFTAPGAYLSTAAYTRVDAMGDSARLSSTSFAAPQITAALALIKLDSTQSGSPAAVLAGCCDTFDEYGLYGSAFGSGLPKLEKLAVIGVKEIKLSTTGGSIPEKLWVGEDEGFLLVWEILPANASDKTTTVESSDSTVLSVRQYPGNYAAVKALSAGEATITVTAGGVSTHVTIHVEQQVNDITIAGAQNGDELNIGDTLQLTAVVRPENASNTAVLWRSVAPEVATVSATGLVTPVSKGVTRIICEAADDHGAVAQVDITVVEIPDAESITLTAEEADISSGSITLEKDDILTLHYAITPEKAPQKVTYTVLPKGIVEVSEEGVLTAVAPGTATVIATASTGKNINAYLSVKVIISPTKVNVSADKTVLDVGEITEATAKISPTNATETKITWSSNNSSIAAVNSSTGVITAVGKGTAKITATTSNGVSSSVTITVRKPITISFNGNGTNVHGDLTSITAYSGYEVGALPTPTRDEYVFVAWFTSDGTKINETSTFESDITLFAHWTANPYTISFDANGGSCETKLQTGIVDSKIGALPTPTRPSYTFLGWYNSADGGEQVTADYVQSTTDELKLYAHWQANPYTMYFNPNGGSCSTAEKTGTVDSAIGTLPAPTRDYYTFEGWYTEDGTEITESYVKTNDSNITVYAHWSGKKYDITFNANGGSCGTSSMQATVDSKVGTLPAASKPYYDFLGWFTAASGGTQVTENYSKSDDSALTLYAHYKAHAYTISFNSNGGSAVTAISGTVDKTVGTLPSSTRSYYDFAGWYTAASGGSKVDASYKQSTDSALTLYAHWTAHTYTMSFDSQGGSTVSPITCTVDTAIGNVLTTPTRSGFKFVKWCTGTNGGTTVDTSYMKNTDENITVYAIWEHIAYTITLNLNGSNTGCSVTSLNGYVDTAVTLPEPTKSYYTFDGWYTAASGGTKVATNYTLGSASAVTLYAHWKANDKTINFSANGGSVSESKRNIKVDAQLGDPPTPTRSGYTFLGWYTAASGGTKISNTTSWSDDTTVTLYAHWQVNCVTYTFNRKSSNGTNLGSETKTVNYGSTFTYTPPAVTGYTAPSSQSITCNSTTAQTVTLTYTPITPSNPGTVASGNWWTASSGHKINYVVQVRYRNRTATTVDVSIIWSNTIDKGAYFGYAQYFTAKCNGVVFADANGNQNTYKIMDATTWQKSNREAAGSPKATVTRSATAYFTVPVSATDTSVSFSGTFKSTPVSGTWSGKLTIPAY